MEHLKRFGRWIKTHQRISIIVAGIVLVGSASIATYAILSQPLPSLDTSPLAVKPAPKYYSLLTGLRVKKESDIKKPVTATIIENSPDARPQSGLKESEIVYEAIAEAGITRFLVIYQQNKPKLIGPVRSLRPYYLYWVKPYDASIAHVGGSSKALHEVRHRGYRDIDQFFNADTYWRASDRYAPHNVYTNFTRLDSLNKKRGYKSSNPKPFDRADESPTKKPTATKISVSISSSVYNSSYRYDRAKNRYIRSQDGSQHKDREKGVITPKVVIVMNVDETTKFEDTHREVIDVIGSDRVTIFQNGTAIRGTWHKSSKNAQLSFKDKKGKTISLVRGQTWITAIPNGKGSVSWKK